MIKNAKSVFAFIGLIFSLFSANIASAQNNGATENQQSINDFNKAIELNPKDEVAYYNRGNTYRTLGNYQQAINDYNKAIELNPKDADAYCNRGVAYYALGNIDMAIQNLKMSAQLGLKRAQDYLRSKGIGWH